MLVEKNRSSGTLYVFANFATCAHVGEASPISHSITRSFFEVEIFLDAATELNPMFSRAILRFSRLMAGTVSMQVLYLFNITREILNWRTPPRRPSAQKKHSPARLKMVESGGAGRNTTQSNRDTGYRTCTRAERGISSARKRFEPGRIM